MYNEGCPRCYQNHILIDDKGTVCISCGLVLSNGSYDTDFENYTVWENYNNSLDPNGISSLQPPWVFNRFNIGNGQKIEWEDYTGIYFREATSIYADACHIYKELPSEIIQDIIENIHLPEYKVIRERFIKNPNQKNSQRLLRHVKASPQVAIDFKSGRTGDPCVYFRRKNFVIKWIYLRDALVDHFEIENPPPRYKLSYDVFDVIARVHDYTTCRFHRYCDSKGKEFTRVALPSTKIYLVTLMVLISPKLFIDFEALVELPLIDTTAKNLILINEMTNFTYPGGYMELRSIICSATEQFWNHNQLYDIVRYLYFYNDDGGFFSKQIEKDYKDSFECLCQKYPLEPPTSTAMLVHNLYNEIFC